MIRYIAEYWSEREKRWAVDPSFDGPKPLRLNADGRIPLTIKIEPYEPCIQWVGAELLKYDIPEVIQIYHGSRDEDYLGGDDYDEWGDDFYEDEG